MVLSHLPDRQSTCLVSSSPLHASPSQLLEQPPCCFSCAVPPTSSEHLPIPPALHRPSSSTSPPPYQQRSWSHPQKQCTASHLTSRHIHHRPRCTQRSMQPTPQWCTMPSILSFSNAPPPAPSMGQPTRATQGPIRNKVCSPT